uniref:SCAN domain-containing protein n=1 Tax=Globodera rostochiensis TaxID=31243 RepID=A0A914HC01_GLORO
MPGVGEHTRQDQNKFKKQLAPKRVCVSCNTPSSGAHFCKKCFEPCHAISLCSISIDGEEGYGAKVICCECWLRDEHVANENANIVKTAPSVRDKPTTSASSPSINYEPNIQLLTSEDEEDSTNPPTKRKRRVFIIHDKIEILDFAKKTSLHAASKHFTVARSTMRKDGAIPNGLPLLRQRRQEEDMIKLVEEIDLNEDENIGSDFSIEL